MLNTPQDLQKTKYCRFLVRPNPSKAHPKSLTNIFSIDQTQLLQDLNDIQKDHTTLNAYSVCGDKQFKTTFINTKRQQSNPNVTSQTFNPQIQQPQNSHAHFNNTALTLLDKNPSHEMKQTIYMNSKHHEKFFSTLHTTQKNVMTRQRKTLERFKQTQKQWQNIDSYLKLRLPKAQTVAFASVKKVYVHENPERLELINDTLPKYWQYSLRNNDKTLKSYAKGHKFKPQVAEEMLQTLKGTRKLQQSIPRIDSQRVDNDFASGEKLRLKAHSVQRREGHQTMRQFHKTLYQNLNQTVKQRFAESQTKSKLKCSRFSTSGNNKNPANQFGQIDPAQELNEGEKRVYDFCGALQSLDKVDNEVYAKKYQKKSKWLHQGLAIGS